MNKEITSNEEQRHFDLRFLLGVLILAVAQFVALFTIQSQPTSVIWYAFSVVLLVIGYQRGRTFGLLVSLIAIFLFGSYNIYVFFVSHTSGQMTTLQYLWFFLFPLSGFLGGHLGEFIRKKISYFQMISGNVDELLLSDPVTGLSSKKRLFFDLQEEIERAKRHYIQRRNSGEVQGEWADKKVEELHPDEVVTLLLFRIQHFEEFVMLYGEEQSNQLLLTVTEGIHASCRLSDRKAIVDHRTFALILPETPDTQAKFVRDRLLHEIDSFQIKAGARQEKTISLQLRFGMASSPEKGATVEELYEAAEKELMYDLC